MLCSLLLFKKHVYLLLVVSKRYQTSYILENVFKTLHTKFFAPNDIQRNHIVIILADSTIAIRVMILVGFIFKIMINNTNF